MIVFIVPLKSQEVSKSWIQTCQLFERCLRSICGQTDANFKVIVVCHENPNIQFSHPDVHYVEVNFTIPQDYLEKERDKGKKVITGLLYARQFSPNHVMVVDADDCLSCHIAEFTNQHIHSNGWVLSKGYVYQENSDFIYYRKSHFYSWCGTCNIMRFDLCPLPHQDDDYPDNLILYYSGKNHMKIREVLESKGASLADLPFIGAIYTIGNGENIYQKGFSTIHNANRGKVLFFMKELLKFRLITSSIRKEFGLQKISFQLDANS